MMFFICFVAYCCSRFSGEYFYIICSSSSAVTRLLPIEVLAADRHDGEITLRSTLTIFVNIPSIARPLIANERAVPCGNTFACIFFASAVVKELHLIHIALIIHAHDRRAVARDGLLRNGLRGEAGIALRRRAGLRAGSAGLGFGFRKGIVVIVGVLLPVDDGIRSIDRRPDGVKRQRRGKLITERKGRAVFSRRPVGEFIARTGGFGGLAGFLITLYELGRDIGAALRVVGDPVAVLNLGREGYVAAVQRDGGYEIAARVLPADDGLLIADGVGDVLRGNRVAVRALLRDHNFATRIGEEHEVHVREAGVIGVCNRCVAHLYLAEAGKLVAAFLRVVPAGELLIRAAGFRRAGVIELFAVLDDLASELVIAVHEDIGMRFSRRLHDAEQRKAITGLRAAGDGHDGRQRVHGRAADEHDQRHQQGKTPTKLVFHKKLILPMKFR